jgi:ribosomal protein L40E
MPQETLGYTNLVWTCPNCGTRNPGPQKKCSGCGAPQPENVEFEQPAEEKLLTDQAAIDKAKIGPDIHCPYCGTRNPADAKNCSQCGGGLVGGKVRASGQILGATRSGPAAPVNCPACGSQNPADAVHCSQCGAPLPQASVAAPVAQAGAPRRFPPLLLGCLGIILLAICGLAYWVFLRPTTALTGTVQSVAWTRSIAIEALAPVQHEDWRSNVPAGATIVSTSRKFHHSQSEPVAGAEKVCGTPYTVDQGNGTGKVVQDCEYRVYQDWAVYTVKEWKAVDAARLTGSDLNPQWPTLRLNPDQRAGPKNESFQVVFLANDKQYTYVTDNAAEYGQFTSNSRWTLNVRGSNVVSVEK